MYNFKCAMSFFFKVYLVYNKMVESNSNNALKALINLCINHVSLIKNIKKFPKNNDNRFKRTSRKQKVKSRKYRKDARRKRITFEALSSLKSMLGPNVKIARGPNYLYRH